MKILLALFVSVGVYLAYLSLTPTKTDSLLYCCYEKKANEITAQLQILIEKSEDSLTILALSLRNDPRLQKELLRKKISPTIYKSLLNDLDQEDIGINVYDKKLIKRYSSYDKEKKNSFKRVDLVSVINATISLKGIVVDAQTMRISVALPIERKNRVIGVLEVSKSFKSIRESLELSDLKSLLVIDKSYKKRLTDPESALFVNGYNIIEYFDNKELIKDINSTNIESYLSHSLRVDANNIVIRYELKSASGKIVGYYLVFKADPDSSEYYIDFFTHPTFALFASLVTLIIFILSLKLYYKIYKRNYYYKNVLDSSKNIVLVLDKNYKVIYANKRFYSYIKDFFTIDELDDFNEGIGLISDMFVSDEGYIHTKMKDLSWVEYLVENEHRYNKVKIKIGDEFYYFSVSLSLLNVKKKDYSVIFSDITHEEYKTKDLKDLTITDTLTGISNRRYFDIRLEEDTLFSQKYKYSLSVIMLDIDHFKLVNDNHGHNIGDDVLVEYTKLIGSMLRKTDLFARIGGEEFIVLLSSVGQEEAQKLAQKIRKRIEGHKKILPITMSFGVTEYRSGEEVDDLLKRVDDALYEAKEGGRNMVVLK